MKRRRKSLLALELLEDRLVPATFTRIADVDGFAADFEIDGNYEYLDTSSTRLETSYFTHFSGPYESRSVMEFNIAGLNATQLVTSARLYGSVYAIMGGGGGVNVTFHGQWGDGEVTEIDAFRPSTPIGQLINPTSNGQFYVDLDTNWVQGQLGQATFVGISMRMQQGVHFYIDSIEQATTPVWPTLVIEYENGEEGNGSPVAADDGYTFDEDSILLVAAPGVLGNDGDPDDDELQAVLVSGPEHGDLSFAADGSFSYVPDPNFHGSDGFVYWAFDGNAYSNLAWVSLTVTPLSDGPPVAFDDEYTTYEDVTLYQPGPGVLANDVDPDGDAFTAELVSGPCPRLVDPRRRRLRGLHALRRLRGPR